MANHMYSAARRLVAAAVLFAAFAACGIGPAAAQAVGRDSGDYQYTITPYLWAARMKGDVKTGRLPKTTLDMKFSDILDTLDLGFMAAIEVRKSRWGLLFDGMYMNVSDSGSASSSAGALSVSADVEVKQTMLALALAYRVLEKKLPLDLIAGMRYNRVEADADIDARLFGASEGSVNLSGDRDWVDPYVGLRLTLLVSGALSIVGYIDAGGFGIGSDFTWQGMAGLNYALTEPFIAVFGYRYMKVDYDKDGFLYDMANDGLYVGMTLKF